MTINYSGIAWVGIYVEDLDRAVEFYGQTLSLRLLRRNAHYAHFDAGAGELLELFSGGEASSRPKGPASQSMMVALKVGNLDDVVETLQQRGVEFTDNKGSFENMSWATLVDPEGNCIEIKEIQEP